jgi:hypothetical protein
MIRPVSWAGGTIAAALASACDQLRFFSGALRQDSGDGLPSGRQAVEDDAIGKESEVYSLRHEGVPAPMCPSAILVISP